MNRHAGEHAPVDRRGEGSRRLTGRRGLAIWVLAAAIFLFAFVYRFNTLGGALGGFDNDQFAHLVRSQEILRGGLPLRDFADADLRGMWPPLTYYTSAAAFLVWGPNLRAEALLSVGLLAAGAAVVFALAARMSGSILAAFGTTLLTVALSPKLYNYPKICLYALAVAGFVWYADRPSASRTAGLAGLTAVAFLYRHDHGVYIGLATICCLAAVGAIDSGATAFMRHGTIYVGSLLVALLPGLVYVQRHATIEGYIRAIATQSLQEARRTDADPFQIEVDLSEPLVRRAIVPAVSPHINIRWVRGLTSEVRAAKEQMLRLGAGKQRDDERSWAYELGDASRENVEAIVRDPLVEDTYGIDRRRFVVTDAPSEPLWIEAQRRFPILTWRILPGIIRPANAVRWLYVAFWGLAILSLASSTVRRWFERVSGGSSAQRPLILTLSVLGLLLNLGFLRNALEARLADVTVPVAILGAWWIAALPRLVWRGRWTARAIGVAVLVLILALTGASAAVVGAVREELTASGIAFGPARAAARATRVWNELGRLPSEFVTAADQPFAIAAHYLRSCTKPEDRVLIGDNLPELHFFAERGFAAGQSSFFSNFYTSEADQRLAVARLARQSVPIALLQPADRFEQEFGSDYPIVAQYLLANYRQAGELPIGNDRRLAVYVDTRRVPTTTYERLGLPCFG